MCGFHCHNCGGMDKDGKRKLVALRCQELLGYGATVLFHVEGTGKMVFFRGNDDGLTYHETISCARSAGIDGGCKSCDKYDGQCAVAGDEFPKTGLFKKLMEILTDKVFTHLVVFVGGTGTVIELGGLHHVEL